MDTYSLDDLPLVTNNWNGTRGLFESLRISEQVSQPKMVKNSLSRPKNRLQVQTECNLGPEVNKNTMENNGSTRKIFRTKSEMQSMEAFYKRFNKHLSKSTMHIGTKIKTSSTINLVSKVKTSKDLIPSRPPTVLSSEYLSELIKMNGIQSTETYPKLDSDSRVCENSRTRAGDDTGEKNSSTNSKKPRSGNVQSTKASNQASTSQQGYLKPNSGSANHSDSSEGNVLLCVNYNVNLNFEVFDIIIKIDLF